MTDILIQPNADADDDLSNAVVIDDATLPLNNQSLTALGLSYGTAYKTRVLGTAGSLTVVAPATAPAAFIAGNWTSAQGSSPSEIDLNITTLPADGGSAITALQYSVDGGTSWAALTGTGTGARTIDQHSDGSTGTLTAATSYDMMVRAVNAVGNGANSDTKATTSGAAAALDSFFEDWTDAGYSINDEVNALSNWTGVAGITTGGATASLFDNGGTTMLRADTANTGMRGFEYSGGATIGDNRRVTVTLAQLGDVPFANYAATIYLHFVDSDNYIRLLIQSNGNLSFRSLLGGVAPTGNWDRTAAQLNGTLTDTSVISFEHNNNDLTVKLNGVTEGVVRTLSSSPATWSAPMVQIGNANTNTILESINLETL